MEVSGISETQRGLTFLFKGGDESLPRIRLGEEPKERWGFTQTSETAVEAHSISSHKVDTLLFDSARCCPTKTDPSQCSVG